MDTQTITAILVAVFLGLLFGLTKTKARKAGQQEQQGTEQDP